MYTDEANKFEISIPQGKNYQSSNIVVTKTMINERNLTALFTQKTGKSDKQQNLTGSSQSQLFTLMKLHHTMVNEFCLFI